MHATPRDRETRGPATPRSARGVLVLGLLAALVLGSGVLSLRTSPLAEGADGVPPLLQRDAGVVTADALPTVQIDEGYVWAQTMIGETVYAVGDFDNARAPRADPGTWLTPRTNALAYEITTGNLDQNFAPEVNGPIKAVAASPDGSRLYIGGSFNRVNGESRWNIAALDPVTGEVLDDFRPAIGGTGVYSLVADGDTVFAGGLFTQANGAARVNTAAFAASDGALRPWAPQPDLQVDAMVADPAGQDIILGGRFMAVNGDDGLQGVGAVHRSTGAVDPDWQLSDIVQNGTDLSVRRRAGIFSLTADDSGVYGTGWAYGNQERQLEGVFAAESGTGEMRWVADCHGDHYGVFSTGETVYTTGHTHACATVGLAPEQKPRQTRYVEAFTAEARGTVADSNVPGYRNWGGAPAPSPYAWYPDFLVGTATGLGQAGLTITGNEEYIAVAGEFVGVNGGNYQGIVRFATPAAGGVSDGPRGGGEDWQPTANTGVPGRARVTIGTTWDRDDLELTYELWREDLQEPVDTVVAESTWWDRPDIGLEDLTAAPGSEHVYTVVARDGDGHEVTSAAVTERVPEGETPVYTAAVLEDEPVLYYPLGDTDAAWAGTDPARFGAGVGAQEEGIANSATGSSVLSGGSTATIGEDGTAAPAPAQWSAEVWVRTDTDRGGKLIGFGDRSAGASLAYDRQVYMTDTGQLVMGTYPEGGARTIISEDAYNDGAWHHVVATQGADGMTLSVDGEVVASDATVSEASGHLGRWRFGGDSLSGWPSRPTSDYLDGDLDEAAVYDRVLSPERIAEHHRLGRNWERPTAEFTAEASGRTVRLDATGAAAGDAEIVAWDWDLGDGTTGEGESLEHTYAEDGTYEVTLTVTDSNGLTSQTTVEVRVSRGQVIVSDGFEREATGSWGTADTGGDWTLAGGNPAAATVTEGAGVLTLPPGSGRTLTLPAAPAADTASEVTYTLSPGPDAGSLYAGTVARSTAEGEYRTLVWHRADGSLWLLIQRGGTVLASRPLPATWRDGDTLHLASEVTGDEETTLRVKAWVQGEEEPEDWQLEHTLAAGESPAGDGASGFYAYRSRSGEDAAVVSVEQIEVLELAPGGVREVQDPGEDG